MRYSYYGKNVEAIIDKVSKQDHGDDKQKVAKFIANQLKAAYLMWNRDSVDDGLIKKHLNDLSHGELTLGENDYLTSTHDLLGKPAKRKIAPKKKSGHRRKN
jgi:hypothetical protein